MITDSTEKKKSKNKEGQPKMYLKTLILFLFSLFVYASFVTIFNSID